MFYLGFDLDTFKRVALIQSLLVVVAIIFDYMERRKTPIFPGCIIYPLLGILFVFGFMPILDFFAALLHKDLKGKAPLIEPNLRRNLGKWST